MSRQRGAGRPCVADEPRTEFYKVRLTKSEKAAIEAMEINLTDMIRALAASYKRKASRTEGLPKAS